MAGARVYLGGLQVLGKGTAGSRVYVAGLQVLGKGTPGARVYVGGLQILWRQSAAKKQAAAFMLGIHF